MNHTEPKNTVAALPLLWRIRAWLFRQLFADEYAQLNYVTAERGHWRALAEKLTPRPARFVHEAPLSETEVARRLAGTIKTPVLEAVMSLLDRKLVEMSDRATNPPSEVNTPDLRTYEAGGANAIAELKSRLEDLAKPQEEEKAKV